MPGNSGCSGPNSIFEKLSLLDNTPRMEACHTKHGDLPFVGQVLRFPKWEYASCMPDGVDKSRRFKWSGNEVVINFGKNAGRTLKDIAENDPGFLRWILRGDFADDVKEIASNALIGKFPARNNG